MNDRAKPEVNNLSEREQIQDIKKHPQYESANEYQIYCSKLLKGLKFVNK